MVHILSLYLLFPVYILKKFLIYDDETGEIPTLSLLPFLFFFLFLFPFFLLFFFKRRLLPHYPTA